MKGLLHSKRFKNNLKKWLFMYICALLVFTTVITYSKYISQYGVEDAARITKFDVEIENIAIEGDGYTCNVADNEQKTITCTASEETKYRPTKDLDYTFKLIPDFEVKTLLTTSIFVPNTFEIVGLKAEEKYIEKVTDKTTGEDKEVEKTRENIILYDKEKNIQDSAVSFSSITESEIVKNMITVKKDIAAGSKDPMEIVYTITVRYKYDETTYAADATLKNNIEVVKVGYSATQEK